MPKLYEIAPLHQKISGRECYSLPSSIYSCACQNEQPQSENPSYSPGIEESAITKILYLYVIIKL